MYITKIQMRSIDSQENNNPAIELLSDLSIPEQKKILESIQKIQNTLLLIRKKVISILDVTSPLMDIDRHVGHYHVQPLLEAVGIKSNDLILWVNSHEQVKQFIRQLKLHILNREANEPRKPIFMPPSNGDIGSIFTREEATLAQVQEILS